MAKKDQFWRFLTTIWTANLNELGLCGQSTLGTATSMSIKVTSHFELFLKLFSNWCVSDSIPKKSKILKNLKKLTHKYAKFLKITKEIQNFRLGYLLFELGIFFLKVFRILKNLFFGEISIKFWSVARYVEKFLIYESKIMNHVLFFEHQLFLVRV